MIAIAKSTLTVYFKFDFAARGSIRLLSFRVSHDGLYGAFTPLCPDIASILTYVGGCFFAPSLS